MLIAEIFRRRISETPISDMHFLGSGTSDFTSGISYASVDKKLLSSNTGKAKIIRAFRNTPFNFEIYFLSHDSYDGDDKMTNYAVDDHATQMGAGVKRNYLDIKGEKGKIKVVLLSNLSDLNEKRPINGWTLAHKIGHAIQDEILNNKSNKIYNKFLDSIVRKLAAINTIENDDKAESPDHGYSIYNALDSHLVSLLTMKSARDNKLDNSFEVFAELVAQYLVSGRVKMNLKHNESNTILEQVNDKIYAMLKTLVGKVLVEV